MSQIPTSTIAALFRINIEGVVQRADLVQLLDYYPFGDLRLNEQENNFDSKKKFASLEHDDDTDLEYAKARYYNANIGKFISIDPVYHAVGNNDVIKSLTGKNMRDYLSDPQGLNSYSYARNNPVLYIDPTGNYWWKGFYSGSGYNGIRGFFMKTGEAFKGRMRALNAIERNADNIQKTSEKYNVSSDIIKAIVYEEQSHLLPGEDWAEKNLTDTKFSGKTIGLGQVHEMHDYYDKEGLLNEAQNIDAIGQHLYNIKQDLNEIDLETSSENIGRMYNSGSYKGSVDYGQRINNHLDNQSYQSNVFDKVSNLFSK